jgi:hypothetical protein
MPKLKSSSHQNSHNQSTADQSFDNLYNLDFERMKPIQLKKLWSQVWNLKTPKQISRPMLIKSIVFKIHEQRTGGMNMAQRERLAQLVQAYKKGGTDSARRQNDIKSGTQLVREWKGKSHTVTIRDGCYHYHGQKFSSLSAIATLIAGTRWNGWTFFGIKKSSAPNNNLETAA